SPDAARLEDCADRELRHHSSLDFWVTLVTRPAWITCYHSSRAGVVTGIDYGNSCSPVSASSTKIALTGQFSAASRIFSTVSPAGSTASDWRLSLRRNTFGAIVSHMAFPTQTSWSTRTRSVRATDRLLLPGDRQRLQR